MFARVIDLGAYRRDGVLRDLSREVSDREVVHAAAAATLLGGRAVPAQVEPARIAAAVPAVAVGAVGRRVHMTGGLPEVRRLADIDLALCGAVRESAPNVTALAHRVTCEHCARSLLAINEARKASGGATYAAEVVKRLARRVRRANLRRWAKRRERARGGR